MTTLRAHHWTLLLASLILAQLYDMDAKPVFSWAFTAVAALAAIRLYVERPR